MVKNKIIHPIIFALYPLFTLYASNMGEVILRDTLVAIPIVLGLAVGVWMLFQWRLKDIHKSAMLTSVFFLLFFSFGYIIPSLINYLGMVGIHANIVLTNRWAQVVLLGIWVIILILFIALTSRAKINNQLMTQFMNVVAIALAGLSIFRAYYYLQFLQGVRQQFNATEYFHFVPEYPPAISDAERSNLPDIYYIILDSYGRSDILQTHFGYDNEEFINFLREKGFYIADESLANYTVTYLSLGSTLNFSYLDPLIEQYGKDNTNFLPAIAINKQHRLGDFLHEMGYELITFSSGMGIFQTDQVLAPTIQINAYENRVINMTPLRFILMDMQYALYRQHHLYAFEQIPFAGGQAKPRFIFAHLILPHPPFVFRSDGTPVTPPQEFGLIRENNLWNFLTRDEYISGYREQAEFVSLRTEQMLEQLFDNIHRPSIIIIQGDHGPDSMLDLNTMRDVILQERVPILNAYYFPDQDYSRLYPGITPVNSFRVILDQYFGTSYGLLEDHSYLVDWGRPYDWTEVTDQVQQP